MPFLEWGLTCGPDKHDAFKRKQEDSIYKLHSRLLWHKPNCGQTWLMKQQEIIFLPVIPRWITTVYRPLCISLSQTVLTSTHTLSLLTADQRASDFNVPSFEQLCRSGDSLSIEKAQRIEIRLFYSPTRLTSLGCTFGEVRNNRHQRETQSRHNSESEVSNSKFPLLRRECTTASL